MVLNAFLRQVEGARVVAAYDSHDETARSASQVFDLPLAPSVDALLDDPAVRGVIIATSNDTHKDLALRALAAGKDVFVEKPVTTTLADADELIRAGAAGVFGPGSNLDDIVAFTRASLRRGA